MPTPSSIDEFLDLIRRSGVIDDKRLNPYLEKLRASGSQPAELNKFAGMMIRDGILTHFQAEQLLMGKWRRFSIGKYKVLERLGSGGMGSVYLCEHKLMRRRVAVKVLPTAKAAEPSSLERFYREARAVASLDHPNIVHAYDIDQDDTLHFLVMEYVDGASLQEIIKKSGPMDPIRAAHYMYQSALGLEHAHGAGLVHRDIKPGNLLVDRTGTLKILDMGLARFFNDEEDILTKKYDEHVLGTADYLAPEQAVDSHEADTRADIYSLGGTFYFLLTGRTPFEEGTVAQKLIWHQTRQPKPITSYRKDVPPELLAIIEKMMAKKPEDRYQHPHEVTLALTPWVQTPIPPPKESEMPRLSPAAVGTDTTQTGMPSLGNPGSSRNNWQVTSAAPTAKSANATPPPKPEGINPAPAVPKPVGASPAPPKPAPANAVPSLPSPPLPVPAAPARPAVAQVASPKPAPSTGVPGSGLPVRPNTLTTPGNSTPLPSASLPAPSLPAIPRRTEPVTSEKIWENLTDDTGPAGFGSETLPESPYKSPSSKRINMEPESRFWLIVTIAVAVGVVIVAVLLWSIFLHLSSQTGSTDKKPLVVNRKGGGDGSFSSIKLALSKARSGDIIELWDEVYEENVVVTPQMGATDVTLRAAPGKAVLWTCKKNEENKPLLTLNKARSFNLIGNGITMDGQGKMSNLVLIFSHCPDLNIEGLQVKGFSQHAVKIMNCVGEEKHYVQLEHLKVEPSVRDNVSLVYFDANSEIKPGVNDYIDLSRLVYPGMSLKQPITRKTPKVTGEAIKLPTGFSWQ